jgi:hypothetical protein
MPKGDTVTAHGPIKSSPILIGQNSRTRAGTPQNHRIIKCCWCSYLEPREVQLDGRAGDDLVVLKGLKEDEKVVTSSKCLIDSESQLQAALAARGASLGT